jgi:hypothetical protein
MEGTYTTGCCPVPHGPQYDTLHLGLGGPLLCLLSSQMLPPLVMMIPGEDNINTVKKNMEALIDAS